MLLEHLRESGQRLVQVSTDEVYGDLEAGGSSRETDPLRPSSPYSAAKAAGDLLVAAYVRTYGVDASITRGSNTYGPNQYPEKFIPLFVTNALDGEPLPLYGDGRQVRDWLHVEDHCAGIELVLREGGPGEIYNVGGGDEHENLEVAQRLLELTGADPALLRRVEDRPGHDRRYSLDTTKLARARLAPGDAFDGRPAGDGRVVPREPGLVGADQVRQLPRVLRAAVRAAARPVPLGRVRLRPGVRLSAEKPCSSCFASLEPLRGSPESAPARRCRRAFPLVALAVLLAAGSARAASVCTGSCYAAPAGSGALFVFTGHGWGHGVGMSQYGAYGYAQHGWTYPKILAHYYPGTTLGTTPTTAIRVLLADGRRR